MPKKIINSMTFIGLALLILSVTACAFKLRQTQLPRALQALYLQTDVVYGPFESMLRQSLLSSGVTLVATPAQAPVTLHIFKPIETNTNTTVGASNQTRVYIITYSVSFELKDATGKVLLGGQTVTTSRTLRLSANQLLETNNHLPLLQQDMRREIIYQMFYRLRAPQVSLSLSSSNLPSLRSDL
jgi:LPS-assembly lipoprotein